ncbi:MAG: RNA polymerase sigma factor [Ketobacter sp.]|nr:MAG: RNA polymerase sigma factor [Ketobacter sp.]
MTSNVTSLNLNAFLASIERRAYRMALLATRNQAEALDIVQDAMLKLCQNYGDRSAAEWAPLFQRILQNRIMDWHRRQQRTQRWFMPWKKQNDDDVEGDGIENFADPSEPNPELLLSRAGDIDAVLKQVEALPIRQQQAFLLRVWEGLDVAATAQAMECSEGAVKSHFHRAIHSLREALGQTPGEIQ